jgi:hypothetical protein
MVEGLVEESTAPGAAMAPERVSDATLGASRPSPMQGFEPVRGRAKPVLG